jgi:type I restriction enzyme S subunit
LHINSEYGKKFITSGEAGGAQKNVNAGMLEKMPLHLPPLPEQRKIAQILSTWDKAITTTERLLTNRQQQKKALMQRLLTGKQRFAGFEEDWKKQQIKDVVSMNYGKSPKDILDSEGIYPVIGTGGITGRSNEFLVNENAVIVGRKGTIDRPTLVKESFWAIDTVFYCLPENGIDITWFYYWISHIDLKQYNESSGLPSLSRETIYAIKLLVPDLVEQQKIASVLSAADAEITAIQNQLDNLKQQKKALMQQLLTGKRRVKVDSPALAAQ